MGGRSSSPVLLAVLAAVVVGAALAACGDGGGAGAAPGGAEPPGSASTAPPDSTSNPGDDAGAPGDGCTAGEAICLSKDKRRACVSGKWVEETCASGSGCFKGACTPSKCSDECTLGESQGGKTCAPFSIVTGKAATLDEAARQHDRARGYLGRMKRESMASGGIGSARYVDETRTKIAAMDGIGDSAIWTGSFLASEAFRLRATGAADARARVRSLVQTMHLWLDVAGEPGMLVRWAKESATKHDFAIGDLDCAVERVHCGVDHGGKKYDFIGHISRDQYQGVMLGLALAYDALTSADEDLRALIRGDVVTLVKELMKERSLPVRVTINGGIPLTTTVTARFVVVSPREMKNGAIDLRVNVASFDDSEMYGFQELYPNLAHLVRQLPGLGFTPDINRPSSAMMLTSFFRVALHVTENAPAYAKDRADILAYYTSNKGPGGNATDWLEIAKGWSDGTGCGGNYYANNIAMMPMYNLARLEDDPARKAVVVDQILGAKMWPAFASTKNVFFSFIYAGTRSGFDPAVVTSAADQLSQFPVAPRVMRPIDLRTSPKYTSRDQSCPDHVAHGDAVDVGDRVAADFMWQRHPWGLYEGGDLRQTHPGVDYLLAYFMGQQHGFLSDDTPGVCLGWQ
jgi:hypothetical protein